MITSSEYGKNMQDGLMLQTLLGRMATWSYAKWCPLQHPCVETFTSAWGSLLTCPVKFSCWVNASLPLVPCCYLFSMTGVKVFLSEHLCQDPFGCQRQRGGTHDNPNVQEFCKKPQALRVINSFCRAPVKGNCRRNRKPIDLEMENTPLPKRKRIMTKSGWLFCKQINTCIYKYNLFV